MTNFSNEIMPTFLGELSYSADRDIFYVTYFKQFLRWNSSFWKTYWKPWHVNALYCVATKYKVQCLKRLQLDMEFISITLHSDKGSIHCQQRSTKQQQIIKYPMISFPRRAFFFFFAWFSSDNRDFNTGCRINQHILTPHSSHTKTCSGTASCHILTLGCLVDISKSV